jgi:hypothetical protein
MTEDPGQYERITNLEKQMGEVIDQLSALSQSISDLSRYQPLGNVGASQITFPQPSRGFLFGTPFILFPAPPPPPSDLCPGEIASGKVNHACKGGGANIRLPGPGSYMLSVTVDRDSDCDVSFVNPETNTPVRIGPGLSDSVPFTVPSIPTRPNMTVNIFCVTDSEDCIFEYKLYRTR